MKNKNGLNQPVNITLFLLSYTFYLGLSSYTFLVATSNPTAGLGGLGALIIIFFYAVVLTLITFIINIYNRINGAQSIIFYGWLIPFLIGSQLISFLVAYTFTSGFNTRFVELTTFLAYAHLIIFAVFALACSLSPIRNKK